ncbi:MAG: HupE/UreJ family protein [Acidimicrobiales bacterium]
MEGRSTMVKQQLVGGRRTSRRLVALVAAIAVVILGTPATSGAHSANEPLVYLDFTDIAVGGRVEFPTPMIEEYLGIPLEGKGQALIPQLEADLPRLQAFADEHLDIIVDGQAMPLTWTGLDILFEEGIDTDLNFVDLGFTVEGLDGEIPRTFDVRFDPFFDETDDSTALLLIGNDIQGGIFENGEEWLIDFDDDNRVRSVDLGDASQWNNFSSSVTLGIDHIKTGPDHILFILVLLLAPSVLVFRNGELSWRLVRLVALADSKIVTMFTVAHTITFSLAGLGILPLPPSKLVESIIAISIALAALHNLKPIAPNKEWAIAFGFGLFHGMGFATLVEGLDVSRKTQLVSLLGRNIGIEIGQTAVVLLVQRPLPDAPDLATTSRCSSWRRSCWPVLRSGGCTSGSSRSTSVSTVSSSPSSSSHGSWCPWHSAPSWQRVSNGSRRRRGVCFRPQNSSKVAPAIPRPTNGSRSASEGRRQSAGEASLDSVEPLGACFGSLSVDLVDRGEAGATQRVAQQP